MSGVKLIFLSLLFVGYIQEVFDRIEIDRFGEYFFIIALSVFFWAWVFFNTRSENVGQRDDTDFYKVSSKWKNFFILSISVLVFFASLIFGFGLEMILLVPLVLVGLLFLAFFLGNRFYKYRADTSVVFLASFVVSLTVILLRLSSSVISDSSVDKFPFLIMRFFPNLQGAVFSDYLFIQFPSILLYFLYSISAILFFLKKGNGTVSVKMLLSVLIFSILAISAFIFTVILSF